MACAAPCYLALQYNITSPLGERCKIRVGSHCERDRWVERCLVNCSPAALPRRSSLGEDASAPQVVSQGEQQQLGLVLEKADVAHPPVAHVLLEDGEYRLDAATDLGDLAIARALPLGELRAAAPAFVHDAVGDACRL